MKDKDIDWLNDKVQDIKKRKRNLKMLLDSTMIKKIKEDLKVERRSVKRAEKQNIKKVIQKEIEGYEQSKKLCV